MDMGLAALGFFFWLGWVVNVEANVQYVRRKELPPWSEAPSETGLDGARPKNEVVRRS